jgi:hypothetical protein
MAQYADVKADAQRKPEQRHSQTLPAMPASLEVTDIVQLKTVIPAEAGTHAELRASCCTLSMGTVFRRYDGLEDRGLK